MYLRYSYLIYVTVLYKRVCVFCKIVCIRNSACNDNFFNPLRANLISSSPLGFDHFYRRNGKENITQTRRDRNMGNDMPRSPRGSHTTKHETQRKPRKETIVQKKTMEEDYSEPLQKRQKTKEDSEETDIQSLLQTLASAISKNDKAPFRGARQFKGRGRGRGRYQ